MSTRWPKQPVSMQSMTGYGESQFSLEGVSFLFRIRSLNSKFLEIYTHTPRELSWLEIRMEELVKQKFSRGKIEIYLDTDKPLPKIIELDQAVLTQFKALFRDHYKKKNVNIPMDVLINIPGLMSEKAKPWRDFDNKLEFYFLKALIKCERMRAKEGKKTTQWLRPKIRLLMRLTQKIAILHRREETRQTRNIIRNYLVLYKGIAVKEDQKVQDSLNRKMWAEIKDELLENFYNDITEEVERLRMHLPETLTWLKSDEDSGKKLEFYFQEILREVNTLTSKTRNTEVNQLGISMKIEIDKIREQLRNIA